jgi:hypothetical protein
MRGPVCDPWWYFHSWPVVTNSRRMIEEALPIDFVARAYSTNMQSP